MTETSVPPQDSPQELLSATHRLTRQVRQAQRGTWFPLLVFGLLTLVAVPVMYTSHHLDCQVHGPMRACVAFSPSLYVYWPLASVLAYAAIAAFYVHRARSRGVGSPVRPYVIAGVVIAVVGTGISLWLVTHPGFLEYWLPAPSPALELLFRLVSPQGAIGLALLVLARVERNRALLVFGLAYLVLVCFGWMLLNPHSHWPWPLPAISAAVLLLLGSAGFAFAERHARRSAS